MWYSFDFWPLSGSEYCFWLALWWEHVPVNGRSILASNGWCFCCQMACGSRSGPFSLPFQWFRRRCWSSLRLAWYSVESLNLSLRLVRCSSLCRRGSNSFYPSIRWKASRTRFWYLYWWLFKSQKTPSFKPTFWGSWQDAITRNQS